MTSDRLAAALVEIERHVGHAGWDQPARLFALVGTARLVEAEPALAAQLARPGAPTDALSSVEQDAFRSGDDLIDDLARIQWPGTVEGCALAVERLFVPAQVEADLPTDPDNAASFVAAHPRRQDVRVVVGVLRDGTRYGVARVRTSPDDLLAADDLVPGLASALSRTLDE